MQIASPFPAAQERSHSGIKKDLKTRPWAMPRDNPSVRRVMAEKNAVYVSCPYGDEHACKIQENP